MTITIIFLLCGCAVSLKKQLTTSISGIKNETGMVLYTFERYITHFPLSSQKEKNIFCLVNCELLLESGVTIPLLDSYESNYFIRELITDDKQLTQKVNELILTEDELFLPPISNSSTRKDKLYPGRRLSDTRHKFELGNIDGYLVIDSDAIFIRDCNADIIYIAFNIQSDLIYYRELNQFVINNVTGYKPDLICRLGNHLFQDNFVVIDKVYFTSNLSEAQISSLNMKKSTINRIRIPIGE